MTTNNCLDFPKWEKCTCCPNGFVGYAESDGVHTYCVGTVKYLAESLTDDKNCDDPLEGSRKDEPTWRVQTYADFVGGKQDPLQDCNGAVLPEDTQVVTCTDMTQREAVLNTAINSRQAPLLSCAGNALPANTRVPTCDEMNNAIANVDTGTSYALRDCGGAALPNNSLVASCDNLTQGMATVAGQIPQLTKCGGDAVDGSLVQCDQLGTDFSVDNDGNITINFPDATQNDGVVTSGAYANQTLTLQRTVGGPVQITGFPSQYSLRNCAGTDLAADDQVVACDEFSDLFDAEFAKTDKCIELVDIGDECGDFEYVTAVRCPTGTGYQMGVVPGLAKCFGTTNNNVFTDVFPTDPDTALGVDLYENSGLSNDFDAGTIDYTLLNNSMVSEGTHNIPCDGSYTLTIVNEIWFTHDYLGVGQWVITVDGVVATRTDAGTDLVFSTPFDNATSRTTDTVVIYLTAGSHVIRRHLVGVTNARYVPPRVYRGIGSTRVCRTV